LSAGDNPRFIAVFVTAATADDAAGIARKLVEERLAACGNVAGPIRSIYRWRGEIHDEPEALLVLKTREELFERLRARVAELHPYEVPEIIALPLEAGHAPYLEWILENTSS
jgi:periplasmic divalent cation tolerance protein